MEIVDNMVYLLIVFIAFVSAFAGYWARKVIAKQQRDNLEKILQEKTEKSNLEAKQIVEQAKKEAQSLLDRSENDFRERKREFIQTEQILLKRESLLQKKIEDVEEKEKVLLERIEEAKKIKARLGELEQETQVKLERISGFSREEAKQELFSNIEKTSQQELLERMIKMERVVKDKLDEKAKEITALAIQRCALSQAQEITTTIVNLPNDEIKGRIIGKEGRNIRTFEELTGTEVIVDDTPGGVVISSFDPIRRHTAKIALEMLIADGRIQPARIEEVIAKAKEQIDQEIKKAGEIAVYDTEIIDLDPKLVLLLGRLKFRTSYGQNVLLHSIETCHLAGFLAQELGADVKRAKKAGLLHDIGKAIDFQIEGSHVDIGIKILEKFAIDKEVINAMKSHHGDYKAENIEALLVQAADQISGARPGARKDTLEQYIKRLEDLENIALAFGGVQKAYAIQAGREIRVFVNPEEIDDVAMRKLAREIANNIEKELKYPGEIKVNVIRQSRVVEHAK